MSETSVDDGPSGRARRSYFGKYPGVVRDNGPPEDGSAHRGEIKVEVPGILEETPDGSGNQPIQVIAAPAFVPGFFFVPEKDGPVWVEFVAGDINHPIWTGVFYPQGAAPTDSAGDAPTETVRLIRSTAGGQVIHLDDTSGSEQLVIKDEKNGNTVTLDQNGIKVEATASQKSVTLVFGQTTVEIKDDSIVLTKGQSKATLKGDSVEIAQGQSVLKLASDAAELKSTNLTLSADAKITLKAMNIDLKSKTP